MKYEIDLATGCFIADRFQSMAVAYPTNYGSIVQTKGADGDPLDVLVLARAPLFPGVIIKVRPIGFLKMVDGGEADEKVIAVPVSKVDPTYDQVKSLNDLPAIEVQRIEAFFKVYKLLPASSKTVEVTGFEMTDAAKVLIKDAAARYNAARK